MRKRVKKGRNIVNIDQLKQMLIDYASGKGLPAEIELWLLKNYLKWLINHFPHTKLVTSEAYFKILVGHDAPAWFLDKQAQLDFLTIDLQHPQLTEDLAKICECLLSQYPAKVNKFSHMTAPQVLSKWQEAHERLYNKRYQLIETSGDGLTLCCSVEEYAIFELNPDHQELHLEMARESAYMQHCLGEFDDIEKAEGGYGAYYHQQIKNKAFRIFSLRDKHNKPHVTISLIVEPNGLAVEQIKGKQNQAPVARYVCAVKEFLNQFEVKHQFDPDCLAMGIIYHDGKSRTINDIDDENTQQLLLSQKPELILALDNPSLSNLWLVSLRMPQLITKLTQANDAMKIAALLQSPRLMTEISLTADIKPKVILQGKEPLNLGERVVKFLKLQPKRI